MDTGLLDSGLWLVVDGWWGRSTTVDDRNGPGSRVDVGDGPGGRVIGEGKVGSVPKGV